MRVLVTGGAGFVGSNLALAFKRDQPKAQVTALDNLKRRGSELTLPRLRAGGVSFLHGDIRNPEDIEAAGAFDLLIDCSAEPSVHAGYGGSPRYLLNTNLHGTLHCLEAARQHRADVVFLSTSRVYPISPLRALPLERRGERLTLPEGACGVGWSANGVRSDFPLAGHRSLYGASKLSAELILHEYAAVYNLRVIINRCGVLTGPWQMGKVDQGFMVLWAARHLYGGPLAYLGFGGRGHQVRDVLHVADLYALLGRQLGDIARHQGRVYNVGGGVQNSLSLAELSRHCAERADRDLAITTAPDTHAADIPYYVSDNSEVSAATGWQPHLSVTDILEDIFAWLREHRAQLEPLLTA